MRIGDWMTRDVVMVAPTTPAAECRERMRECGLRTLPVVDDGALVGRLTDAAVFGPHATGATASDLMTPVPLVANPTDALYDVLARCAWSQQYAVIVVERGRVVGIFTEHDACVHAERELPVELRVEEAATLSPMIIEADKPALEAALAMRRRWVRHIVVVDNGVLFGVLSDRDVRVGSGRDRTVRDLVAAPVVWTAFRDMPLKKAAGLMATHHVGCLPVVDQGTPGRVDGILSRSDILRALMRSGVAGQPDLTVAAP